MKREAIRLNRTYETPAGYRLRVQDIDHLQEVVEYRVVRGSRREPLDMVGKQGRAKLSSFASRVQAELPRILLVEGSQT